MSYITAKKHLEENNLDDRIIEFNTSTATVALAAKALGVSDGEIAKSMSFIVNDNPILVIVAGLTPAFALSSFFLISLSMRSFQSFL